MIEHVLIFGIDTLGAFMAYTIGSFIAPVLTFIIFWQLRRILRKRK